MGDEIDMSDEPSTSLATVDRGTEEEPTVRALRSAFGCSEDSVEVREFLRAVGVDARAIPSKDRKSFPGDCEYVNYKSRGVSLCFDKGRCDTVHLYRAGVDGYEGYRGGLPLGITMDSAAVDVVRVLGEPTGKGGAGRMIFLSYDHLGIKFDIAATRWDEPDAKICCVAVWDADAGAT